MPTETAYLAPRRALRTDTAEQLASYRSSATYRRARAREDRLTFACLCLVVFVTGFVAALLLAASPVLEG